MLRRLDKTFKAFFARGKGFPRFHARARYHAAELRVGDVLTIRKNGRIGFVGVPGDIKIRRHPELPSKPASAILTRQAGNWYVVFHVEVDVVERASPDAVGLDLGLTSLIALSNDETKPRPNWTDVQPRSAPPPACCRLTQAWQRHQGEAQSCLGEVSRLIANRRRDQLHNLFRSLVDRFGRIAIEDLNIKGLARGMLAKHVNDASWAQLTAMLEYKAASAGVEFVRGDPRGTSQECPGMRDRRCKDASRTHAPLRMRMRYGPGRCCRDGRTLSCLRFLARSGPWFR